MDKVLKLNVIGTGRVSGSLGGEKTFVVFRKEEFQWNMVDKMKISEKIFDSNCGKF